MKNYILIHEHRFGSEVYPFKSDVDVTGFYNHENEPPKKVDTIIGILKIDWERQRMDESVSIEQLATPKIIKLL